MNRQVILAGLLGGVVMLIWLVISNAILPFKSGLMHDIAPRQLELHAALKESIVESGCYSVPYLSPMEEERLPGYREQPVYTVIYEGVTHGEGSPLSIMPFLIIFAVPLLAAWLLSRMSAEFLASYGRRLLFCVAIGVIVALYDDVLQMSFGPQPKDYLIFLALNNLITWTLAGFVIAWRMKPA